MANYIMRVVGVISNLIQEMPAQILGRLKAAESLFDPDHVNGGVVTCTGPATLSLR
jgi:hypothetical protein